MKTIIIFLIIFCPFYQMLSEESKLSESFRFLGNDKASFEFGGINAQMINFNDNVSAIMTFPFFGSFYLTEYDRLKIFFWPGLYQSELKRTADYKDIYQMGAELSHFLLHDNNTGLSLRLRHNLVQTSLLDISKFYNFSSIQARFEHRLASFSSKDGTIGDLRGFVILGSYYSYEQKVGGVSLIAGFSIGHGLRVSFDFGSFFLKNSNNYKGN